jgi:hypothetical protein
MNTSKYTKNTILLQTELSVPSSRRVLFSGQLMVSNQHSDAGSGITGVTSLSTFLLFLSSKPDYSWEIKEQIFKWCHTHRPLLSLPRFLPLTLLSAAHVPDSKDQHLTSNNGPQFKITYCCIHAMTLLSILHQTKYIIKKRYVIY